VIREHEFFYKSGTLLVLYTDGIIEFSHDAGRGEAKLLKAARDAVDAKVTNPATFIVESVLRDEQMQYPDDVAVMTIFFE
jgi:serine phosphatase RsbU (regulator of sigma subunit)